jgi:DNA-binding transcriptional regulator YiaG
MHTVIETETFLRDAKAVGLTEIDTARIRKKINMSQSQFAAYFGVSVRTVQEWEQGRVVPSRSARAFLTVIDREPEAVRRALLGSSTGDMPTTAP